MNRLESRTPFSPRGSQRAVRDVVWAVLRWTRVTAIALGMILLSPGAAGIGTVWAQGDPSAAGADRLDALFRAYASLLDAVDPLTVDVDELAFELAFESPESIAAWVRTNVAYQPYRGLLRGPQGTLLAQAGNSLDQAVLLARLLNDAGYVARVAVADLPEGRVAEVWDLATRPESREDVVLPETSVVGDDALLTESQLSDAQDQLEEAVADLEATFIRERDSLTALLDGDPNWSSPNASIPDDLAEDSYAWVETRMADGEPWARLHPIFATVPSWVDELEAAETFADAVPPELQHRLRFQVVIEQRLGGELEEKAITEAWERPVANLVGQSFTFASMPDTLSDPAQEALDVDAAFADATFIYPLFNDALAPGAQLFDLNGNTAPPEAASSPAAGIFQTVGNAFGGAIGAIGGDEEPVALTAQWLEFTLIEPGGAETVHRRAIFDRIGAVHRAAGSTDLLETVTPADVVDALQASHSFMLDPGAYPVQYVQRSSAEAMLELEPYLRTLFAAGPGATVADLAPPPELMSTVRSFEHFRQFLTFDARIDPSSVISYRNAPALSMISKSWDGSWEMSDVIQNARVSLERGADGVLRLAPQHAQAQGVWETVTEGVVLSRGGERFSVPEYMRTAREQGVPFVIIDSASPEQIDALNVPDDSRAAMRTDLERGYLVVSPRHVPDGMSSAAWWRVDPATGTTLGRGFDGRGVESLTYITVFGVAISVVFGIAGFASCVGGGGSGGCCLEEGIGWFAVGFALGAAVGMIGGALGLSALAAANLGFGMGAAFDFATFNMGLAGILPTGCTSSRRPDGGPEPLMLAATVDAPACDLMPSLRTYFQRAIAVPGA